MDLDLTRNNLWVLYHAGCLDGFTAAWAARKVLGDNATYAAISYRGELPDIPYGSQVILLDITFPREDLLDLKRHMSVVLVLDHHDSAEKDLAGLDFCVFDMEKSGARLAWEFFHGEGHCPWLVSYVEDYDLWTKTLRGVEEVNVYLHSLPSWDWETWDDVSHTPLEEILDAGASMVAYRTAQVKRIAKQTFLGEVGGHMVPIVNSSTMINEVAYAALTLFPDAPFAAVYYLRKDGIEQWSLRNTGDFDVSTVAKGYLGGGHKSAAGFQVPTQTIVPFSELLPDPPSGDENLLLGKIRRFLLGGWAFGLNLMIMLAAVFALGWVVGQHLL